MKDVVLNACPKCARPLDDHIWRDAATREWYGEPRCPGGPLSVVDPLPKG